MIFGSKKSKDGESAGPPTAQQSTPDAKAAVQATDMAEPALSPEEARKRAVASKQIAAAFGGIVALAMRAPAFRHHALQDLEWLVAPAVVSGQFAIAEAQAKATGITSPVACVLWAFVSAEVDRRLSTELDAPIRLRPDEWRSGEIPWIVMTLGDQRVIGRLLKQLTETVFKARPARLRARGADGKVTVGRIEVSGTGNTSPG